MRLNLTGSMVLLTLSTACAPDDELIVELGDVSTETVDHEDVFEDGHAGAPSWSVTAALIPTMSSNTTPSGLVTRSGAYASSYEAWQAFDATSTLWLSNMNTSSVWIGYEWGGGASKTVTSYEIKYANGSCCQQRGPKNWSLQGWSGSTWVTVDTVTNQTGWYSNPNRTYTVDTPGSYSKYRLYITADNYNNATYPITLVSIATFQLHGSEPVCSPPPPGMIAWWTLDGTTGANTSPDSIGSNVGWHYNGPADAPGTVYGALGFDGIDDYVRASDSNPYTGNPDGLDLGRGDFSILFWIRVTGTTGIARIVDKFIDSGSVYDKRGYAVDLNIGRITLYMDDDVTTEYGWTGDGMNVGDGAWHFVAITVDRDSPSGLRYYRDGALLYSFDPRPVSGSLTNGKDFFVGTWSCSPAYCSGGVRNFFNGYLDELQMFNRALSSQEVQGIHSAGSAGQCLCRNC